MATVDELVVVLGAELSSAAKSNINAFKQGLSSVMGQLKALASVAGVAYFGHMVAGAADAALEMGKLSEKLRISTTDLQEWQYAAERVGASGSAVVGDMQKLYSSFGKWTGRSSEDMLTDLADRFAGMSQQQAERAGSFYGLSDDTIRLLRQGREGISALRDEAQRMGAIIPPEAIERASEFSKNVKGLTFAFNGLTQRLWLAFAPGLNMVVDGLKGFIQKSKQWIALKFEQITVGFVSALERLKNVFSRIVQMFQPIIAKFKQFTEYVDGTEFVTNLLTAALLALAIALAPLALTFAKLAAVGTVVSLVLEDIFTFMEGGDSIVGRLVAAFTENFPNITKLLKDIASFIRDNFISWLEKIATVAKAIAGVVIQVFGSILSAIDENAKKVAEFFGTFSDKYPRTVELLGQIADVIGSVIGGAIKLVISLVEQLFNLLGKVMGPIKEAADWLFSGVERGLEALGFGSKKTEEQAAAVEGGVAATAGTPRSFSERFSDRMDKTLSMIGRWFSSDEGQEATATVAQPLPGGATATATTLSGTTVNDNKTVNISVQSNDPATAGKQVAKELSKAAPLNAPGLYAPAVS